MENASKALLIAAGVLVVILIIAVGMRIFNSTTDTAKSATDAGNTISKSTQTASNILTDILDNKGEGQSGSDVKVQKIILSQNNINASSGYTMKNGRACIYWIGINQILPNNATNKNIKWTVQANINPNISIEQNDNSGFRFVIYENEAENWGIINIIAEAQDGSNVKAICSVDTSGFCFKAGTKILTENGLKNIEDIKIGEKVYSKNESNSSIELKEVLNTFVHDVDYNICKVYTENDIIECTEGHKFYSKSKGWVQAYNLRPGNVLIDNNGKEIVIKKVEIEKSKYKQITRVYNLNVKDNHNYFVGNDRILAHNAGCPT